MPGVEGPASVLEIASQPSAAPVRSERKALLEVVAGEVAKSFAAASPWRRPAPRLRAMARTESRPSHPGAPGAGRSNHGPSSSAIATSSARKRG